MSETTAVDSADTSTAAPAAATPTAETAAAVEEAVAGEVAEGGEAEAPAEPVAKAKPASDKLAAIARREKQLRDRMTNQRSQIEQQTRQLQAQVGEFQQKYNQLNSIIGELKSNPIEFLQKNFNIGPEEYYSRVMNNGAATKDEVLAKELQATREQLQELAKWRQEREEGEKRSAEEARQAAEQRAAQEAYETAQNEFWAIAGSDEKYPNLAVYPRDVVLQQAQTVVQQLGRKASNMSYEEIADIMEGEMREWHERIVQKRGSKAPAAVQEAVAESAGKKDQLDDEIEEMLKPYRRVQAPKVEKRGPVNSTTLNKNMAVRTSGKVQEEDPEVFKKRLIAELNALGRSK